MELDTFLHQGPSTPGGTLEKDAPKPLEILIFPDSAIPFPGKSPTEMTRHVGNLNIRMFTAMMFKTVIKKKELKKTGNSLNSGD